MAINGYWWLFFNGYWWLFTIVHQKSHILVANDNIYMISQRMKAYFVDFFFHPKFVVVCD
jgi:hypothetical protein